MPISADRRSLLAIKRVQYLRFPGIPTLTIWNNLTKRYVQHINCRSCLSQCCGSVASQVAQRTSTASWHLFRRRVHLLSWSSRATAYGESPYLDSPLFRLSGEPLESWPASEDVSSAVLPGDCQRRCSHAVHIQGSFPLLHSEVMLPCILRSMDCATFCPHV